MTELIFLGVGAIRPAVPGDHTALLIQHGPSRILLDAGPAIFMQLDRAGVSPDEISHVYFSHQHGDHTLGSPIFMFYHRRRTFMAAPLVLAAWKNLLEVVYPGFAETLSDEMILHPLFPQRTQPLPAVAGVSARLAPANHSGLPAYALRLDFAETKTQPHFSVVYSGDTAPTEKIIALAQGADLLIHEATIAETLGMEKLSMHTSARQAGAIAQAAGVQSLALVHRLAGDREVWIQEAAEQFEGRILAPLAGDRLTLFA
ncbi:MAG: ribonuclease Z [Chloroflexi bacterium]|nr:ribonuclease Z [Chloroflexota bacterium]